MQNAFKYQNKCDNKLRYQNGKRYLWGQEDPAKKIRRWWWWVFGLVGRLSQKWCILGTIYRAGGSQKENLGVWKGLEQEKTYSQEKWTKKTLEWEEESETSQALQGIEN